MEPGASGVSEHNTRTTLSILPSCQVLKTTPVVFPSISTEFLTSDLKSGDKNNPLSIEETNNYWDKITTCTRGSGEVVSVAGPYTIPLISPDMQYEGEDEVFSFNYITDCARNNRQLDLNRYRLNKQSQFKPEFNFRDILEKKITWSEARSRWKIDDINLDQNPLPQTLCSVKPTNRSYSLKEEQTILKYIADNNMYDKVKGRQMWQFMASSRGGDCENTVEAWHTSHSQDVLSEVKEGFGNQINLCQDLGLNLGPPAQKPDNFAIDSGGIDD
uniref:Telomeric repeat-binding factor 2-interacting protein 1 n=1 Tax=Timema douglasi TaxID=61478 RepID=A0A7R8Z5D5_TIMDO|nr:unnamed protein product [Timema douglasi]